jgi:citrate synthase
MASWITAEAAAQRLGIKRATLYAYVSRGVLVRRRAPGGRGSLFDAAEIEKLARRGRPRRAPGGAELVIESALTEISGDRLRYRGQEATALAVTRSFEDVASLLWTRDLTPRPAPHAGPAGRARAEDYAPAGWRATPEAVAVGTAAQSALPAGALPLERLQVIVPALAATDPLRLHLDHPAVVTAGRALIAGMVDCLPDQRPPPAAGLSQPVPAAALSQPVPAAALSQPVPAAGLSQPVPAAGLSQPAPLSAGLGQPAPRAADLGQPAPDIALRLWGKICPAEADGLLVALRAALVLLADHELAASTLAVRVAASVRADPYAAVATGLGALGGPLHGGASLGAEAMLAAAAGPRDAPSVVGDLLRRTGRVPGFGHFVYRAGDPRAVCLLDLVARGAPQSPRLAVAQAVRAEMRRRALPEPNIDFALAVLADVAGMISGAGEAVFAVARTAGWIAHALEEYAREVPLRPRAIYTGPTAGDTVG